MGFDIVARPNNHANDYGYEGLLETGRHLERAGLQHSGIGDTYWAARAARFYTTPRGRVGMVATSENSQAAAPGNGEWAGRGGLSPFNVTTYLMVPADSWEAVRTVRNLFPNGTGFYARGANTADRISAVGQQFRKAPAGVTQPYYSYDINQRDLRDVLAAVREGKMRSDFITVALHSHDFADTRGGYRGPGIPEQEHLDTNPSIADYLPVFAKAAIDNGAASSRGPACMCCAASRSTRTAPSSTASVNSSVSATSADSPVVEIPLGTNAPAAPSPRSTRASSP